MTAGNTQVLNEASGLPKSLPTSNATEYVNQWQAALSALYKSQAAPNGAQAQAAFALQNATNATQAAAFSAAAQNLWAAQAAGAGAGAPNPAAVLPVTAALQMAAAQTGVDASFLNAAAAQAVQGSQGLPANFLQQAVSQVAAAAQATNPTQLAVANAVTAASQALEVATKAGSGDSGAAQGKSANDAPHAPQPKKLNSINLNSSMDSKSGSEDTFKPNPQQVAAMSLTQVAQKEQKEVDNLNGWDERELKKQRRKQSNRESARRSRLRKQAECEELSVRVACLSKENTSLQSELLAMKEKCESLTTQNKRLQEILHSGGSAPATAAAAEDGATKKRKADEADNSAPCKVAKAEQAVKEEEAEQDNSETK